MAVSIETRIEETGPVAPDRFLPDIASRYRPIVMRGQAAGWPAVQAARRSDEALVDYIHQFDSGKPAEILIGPPEIGGRFFYNDAMRGCNFQKRHAPLHGLFARLLALRQVPGPDALYAGAAAAGDHLPGWAEANPFPFPVPHATPRIWIGNATHVSTHFDESSNVAIVISGKRRFTLFPPEQLANLYVGPLHFTIAGPPVSMVDLENPDFDRYPRFAEALRHAVVADLEPGDALFIPPIWWHNVHATAPFNVMMNYWWERPNSASPLAALLHGILSIRDLPREQRLAWKRWFDHYIFDDAAPDAADHLPEHVRGPVGSASQPRDAMIRQHLLRSLGGG